jgi:hypothetical protein
VTAVALSRQATPFLAPLSVERIAEALTGNAVQSLGQDTGSSAEMPFGRPRRCWSGMRPRRRDKV